MNCLKNNDEKFNYIDKLLKSKLNKSEILVILEIIKSKNFIINSSELIQNLKWKAPNANRLLKTMYDKSILDRYLDVDGKTYIYKISENFKPS